MKIFRKVSEIPTPLEYVQVRNADEFYLTFDLDWCHEEVLIDSLSLVEQFQAKATLFITNKLDCIGSLMHNSRFELGIHPNFNLLIENGNSPGGAEKIVDYLMNLVPSAQSVRSHSLATSSKLSSLFFSMGLTHESNYKLPFSEASAITPFLHPSGMIMCPYQWGDYSDINTAFNFDRPISYIMADFHPIHVFLNTENLDRYERTRPLHQNPKELIKHRYDGYGTRSRLLELLELAKDA